MIDLDLFLPNIMPYALGCPDPVAHHNIRQAAQEFCERTRLWRDSDEFAVSADNCSFVCVPDGAELYQIEHASFDGKTLTPTSIKDLDRGNWGWRDSTDGVPRWITQIGMDTVQVVPGGEGTLRLQTVLRPSDDAEQLPAFIGKHHRQLIAEGALARILMLPGQSFTDPTTAQFYSMRFDAGLNKLFNRNIQGQQRAPSRTRPSFM